MISWFQDFKKPINMISLIISVLSLSFAVITYDSRSAGRELSYKIIHNKIIQASPLTELIPLFTEAGLKVDQDVYVAYMSFWNSGKISINKTDILKGITVILNDDGRFLSVKKISTRGDGISDIKANAISNNVITLELDQLDLDMGAKYRILYTGNKRAKRSFAKIVRSYVFSGNNRIEHTIDISGHIREGRIIDANALSKKSLMIGLISTLFLIVFSVGMRLLKIINLSTLNADIFNNLYKTYSPYVSFLTILSFCVTGVIMIYILYFGPEPAGLAVSLNDIGMNIDKP